MSARDFELTEGRHLIDKLLLVIAGSILLTPIAFVVVLVVYEFSPGAPIWPAALMTICPSVVIGSTISTVVILKHE